MSTYIGQRKQSSPEQEQKELGAKAISNQNKTVDDDGLPALPKGERLSIVLIGKTGQGKSETANSLCNRKQFFEATDSSSSVTVNNQSTVVTIGGRSLKIVDTPGCMDTKKGHAVLKEIADAITTAPEGYDAFLIVVKYPARMTAEELGAIKQLERLFGKEMYDYSVVIFTHGDCFYLKQENSQDPKTFEEYVEKDMSSTAVDSLGPLLKKVDGRAVLFSNFEKDPVKKRQMVVKLVEKIEEIRQKKGGRYDNKLFEKAREYEQMSSNTGERSGWLYEYILKALNIKAWCSVM